MAELKALYEVVDRVRVSAKDAQNLVDRSLTLSHSFVPIIDSVYPCAGADKARNNAHRLHLAVGLAKDSIGNPPGGAGGDHGLEGESQLGRGAADLLAEMERSIGKHSSSSPGGLHPMLDTE